MFKLTASYIISSVCSWTIGFLVPLYIYSATKSATWTSLAYIAALAPYILVTPFAGVWSDRYRKKHFLVGSDVLSIIIGCSMFAAIYTLPAGIMEYVLLLMAFLLASASATHHPMFQSIAPELMASNELVRFNGLINAIDNMVRIGAPLIVAAALAWVSKSTVLAACISGYIFSILLCALLPGTPAPPRKRTSVMADLKEGFACVLENRNLISFSVLFLLVNFGLTIIGANLAYIFLSLFKVAPANLGYYYGLIGGGAVLGSFCAPFLVKRLHPALMIVASCFLAGVFALGAGLTTLPLGVSILWGLSMTCQSCVIVGFFTYRQTVVPAAILGRTIGVTRLISYLAIPPAGLLGGWLMERYQSSLVVFVCGGVFIVLASGVSVAMRMFHPQRRASEA
ncbi:MFS transporter (plasmid) [Burkholderia sp. SFA1]|uniref:MFS transporter n=1 Tax=unclassified Caballeronia TaxID=2646786 RepID=UPI001F3A6D69|nr:MULTISPECIES: MFS transporter [unclassified Caballeronia]MCE4545622.1 MFS transporter [Caballeronia sp. PC1]MCE4572254.1 MFS transporter [Caballeronia sp. CLC5]BBQ00973.1 MFS transporter [Burkholderia sp. SFA1]